MALQTNESAWVARFLGSATPQTVWNELSIFDELKARNAVERREIAVARVAARGEAARRLEKHVPTLEQVAEIKIAVRSGIKPKKKKGPEKKLALVGVDPEQTYGHSYDIPTEMIDGTLLIALGQVEKDFLAMARDLAGRTAEWSVIQGGEIVRETRPLFDKMDASEAVYAPFVRRGLFPEDQILAEFSKAQKMIEESNKLYLEDLAEIEDEPDWQNTATQIQTVLSGIGSVVTASVGISETVDPTKHDMAKDVGTVVTIVDASLKALTVGVVEFSKKNAEDATKGLLEGIGTAIGAGVGGDTGKYIALGFKSAAQVPALVKTLRTSNSDGEMTSRLLAQLGDCVAIGVSFDNIGKSGDHSHTATQISTGIKAGLVVIGKAFEKDLLGAVKKARRGDMSALKRFAISYGAAVAREVTVTVTTIMSAEVIKAKSDRLDPDKNPDFEQTSEYKTFLDSVKGKNLSSDELPDAWKSYRGDLASGWSSSDASGLASQSGAADAALAALETLLDGDKVSSGISTKEEEIANRDAIEYEEEDYVDSLQMLQDDPPKEALARVGKLIAKIQKQRAIMALISGVVKTGSAAAARFWGAAAAAGTALDLAMKIKEAVETHQELVIWRKSAEYAENAVSPYFTSVVSFVEEQERLYPRDVIKAIMLTVKLGGELAQADPTFGTAIGKLVVAIEGVAESSMDLICAQVDASKVKKAWRITRIAFEDPENRKAALIARKLNPTLAKYSLAWGAMVEKNVVAQEACREIGLVEGDLRAPDDKAAASVRILVQYLEVRYNRHLQVKKHYAPDEDPNKLTWSKDVQVGALVVETWLALNNTAVEKGMKRISPNKVAGALYEAWSTGSNLDREVERLYDISRDKQQHITSEEVNKVHIQANLVKKALADCSKAIRAFKPVRADDEARADVDMEAVLELYLGQIDAEEMNIDMKLSALDMAVERERLTGFGDTELQKMFEETQEATVVVLVKESVGELNEHIARVEGCNHTDELEDLKDVYDGANDAIEKIEKRTKVVANPAVSSVVQQLRDKLAPLGRLIQNLEREEEDA